MSASDAAVVARWSVKLTGYLAALSYARRQRDYWSAQYHRAKKGTPRRSKAYRTLIDRKDKVAKLEAQVAAARRVIARRRKGATYLSRKGLTMLVREEGSVPYAYNDPAGHATFGVGHLLHLGPVNDADRKNWGTKANPKPELVVPTLKKDIAKYEQAVRRAVRAHLSQHEFDACVSLCFNIGTAGFASSTVVKRLNAGDDRGAADAFLMWDNPSMLRPRRERERRLFLTGKYT